MPAWIERQGTWVTIYKEGFGISLPSDADVSQPLRTYVKQCNWQYRSGQRSEVEMRTLDNSINALFLVNKARLKKEMEPLRIDSWTDITELLPKVQFLTVEEHPGMFTVPGAYTRHQDYFA
jgi:hypothetical protein